MEDEYSCVTALLDKPGATNVFKENCIGNVERKLATSGQIWGMWLCEGSGSDVSKGY